MVRGGGDLGSGVAHAFFEAGFQVIVFDLEEPTMVRRRVSFGEAIRLGELEIEGVRGVRHPLESFAGRAGALPADHVLVSANPNLFHLTNLAPEVLVDAIMSKRSTGTGPSMARAVVALGPGFEAGRDAHAVVETARGADLGRIYRSGRAIANTGVPGEVEGKTLERILRAPRAGRFRAVREIGEHVAAGQRVGDVDGAPVLSRIDGRLRGLISNGVSVASAQKIGDVDPRDVEDIGSRISDKSRTIGHAALAAAISILISPPNVKGWTP